MRHSPETYFQAAFRVQSPWSIKNPNGDNPNEEEILKPICFVFDFAPTRALRQLSEYGIGPATPEAEVHASIATFTHAGIGAGRTRPRGLSRGEAGVERRYRINKSVQHSSP